MAAIWLETRHPNILGESNFQIDSLIIKYIGLFLYFTWPSFLGIFFLKTLLKYKLAILLLFIVLWGAVVFVTLIFSVIFIGGAYP